MLYIAQLIYVKEGKEKSFHAFEKQAIALMSKYTGKIIQRIRPDERAFIEGEERRPYEIHIVSFDSEHDMNAFIQDDERQKFLHLKEESVKSILMFKGNKL